MPIKKENKHLYPDNWQEIRKEILFRAKNKCEFCGVANHRIGFRNELGQFVPVNKRTYSRNQYISVIGSDNKVRRVKLMMIVLTIMHLDHNPGNNDRTNLKAGCQKCHNNYDKEHRAETRKEGKK